jgi:nucleoside 2-deoxyribosyltransferase
MKLKGRMWNIMATCFVIQPFDGGSFDNRYEDILVPAITAAGLEPYRVDRDPEASIPIEDIQNGIKNAEVVLAEISLDNPNVWFELGFAIASQKEVVLICSDQRDSRFPFDIQHRRIIQYTTGSLRDFEHLKKQIIDRLKAINKKQYNMGLISTQSPLALMEGLTQHEMTLLVSITQNIDSPNDTVSTYIIKQDMSKAGFTPIASILGLDSLANKGFVQLSEEREYNGEPYKAYSVTSKGINWLHNNTDKLVLKQEYVEPIKPNDPFNDDDLPF